MLVILLTPAIRLNPTLTLLTLDIPVIKGILITLGMCYKSQNGTAISLA